MAQEKEREMTKLEISYEDPKDLDHLAQNKEFISIILQRAYKEIKHAIENKEDKVRLFNVANLSLIVELKRENYNKVLTKVLDYYEQQEDFEECTKIQNLLNTPL